MVTQGSSQYFTPVSPIFIVTMPRACLYAGVFMPLDILGQMRVCPRATKIFQDLGRNVIGLAAPCLRERSPTRLTVQAKLPEFHEAQWIGDTNLSSGWSGINLHAARRAHN